jgi:hypothetical protein
MARRAVSPVMPTTGSSAGWHASLALRKRLVGLDVVDCVLHGSDVLYVGFGNHDAERRFEGDDKLDRIQTVGAEVIDQRRSRHNVPRLDAEMRTDNAGNLCNCFAHASIGPRVSEGAIHRCRRPLRLLAPRADRPLQAGYAARAAGAA